MTPEYKKQMNIRNKAVSNENKLLKELSRIRSIKSNSVKLSKRKSINAKLKKVRLDKRYADTYLDKTSPNGTWIGGG